mmetsp:Transcript_43355/g.70349  ORF Transcript_43355/g.70349 Transcript_43355/m.70349 type:complete len:170 (-) Transcript_43355:417-926(-)
MSIASLASFCARTRSSFLLRPRAAECVAAKRWYSKKEAQAPKNEEKPTRPEDYKTMTFIDQEGESHQVKAKLGENVLEIAHENDIELEGACEGSLACSTCHVYVDPAYYPKIPEPSDEENDMLDLAFGLTQFSRLGCQIKMTPELEGLVVTLPKATRNMAVDGYVPKPH